jgi:hypothetical protein
MVGARRVTTRALMALLAGSMLTMGVVGQPSPASARDTLTWFIDANRMRVPDAQEESLFSDGDEPYAIIIAYRSRFGTPNSTFAVWGGDLRELSGGADDGANLAIPDAMGRYFFPGVTRVGAADVIAGQAPEIIGTITVAMESDATPWSAIRDISNRLTTVIRQEIATIVEGTTMADFVGATMDPARKQALADRVEAAVGRIQSRMTPSFWQALGLFLSSWTDPDDRIAFRMSAFATVDSTLSSFVDAELARVLPPSLGVGGALTTRNITQRYAGDGATYDIESAIFSG